MMLATENHIRSMAPMAGDYMVRCAEGGLWLRVRKTGRKTFVVRRTSNGKKTVTTIGRWPETSLREATERFAEIRRMNCAQMPRDQRGQIKHTMSHCRGCDSAITPSASGYFITVDEANAIQVCHVCHQGDVRNTQAKEQNIRFTEVDCTSRCPCGAVIHARLGWCVRCWKITRMLDKGLTEAKSNRRLINHLIQEIKHENNQNDR